jgi:hypothetical protein
MPWTIYGLLDPRDESVRYVGFSTNLSYRYKHHVTHLNGTRTPLRDWMRELRAVGVKPLLQILEVSSGINWAEREAYWISVHASTGLLLNLSLGGEGATRRPATEEEYQERFWSRVNKNSGLLYDGRECWVWTAGKNSKGYGYFWYRNHTIQGHQIAWALAGNEQPEGLELDHLCRRHDCVRPDHLELVTRHVNQLRGETLAGVNARKTHCPKGHPYSPENTFVNSVGGRVCITCQKSRTKGGGPGALRTHCPHGHEYTPENTILRQSGNGVRACRECSRLRCLKRYYSIPRSRRNKKRGEDKSSCHVTP